MAIPIEINPDHDPDALARNDGNNFYESSMEQLKVLAPSRRQKFMTSIYSRARTQFQYLEHVFDSAKPGMHPP